MRAVISRGLATDFKEAKTFEMGNPDITITNPAGKVLLYCRKTLCVWEQAQIPQDFSKEQGVKKGGIQFQDLDT